MATESGTILAPSTDESITSGTTADAQRRRWAYSLLRKASTPPPSYGSEDWLKPAEGTPEKVASVVVAAECWATGADHLADDLAVELDIRRVAEKETADAEYRAKAATHREQSRHLPNGKSFADRRAAQIAAAAPREGDFNGVGR